MGGAARSAAPVAAQPCLLGGGPRPARPETGAAAGAGAPARAVAALARDPDLVPESRMPQAPPEQPGSAKPSPPGAPHLSLHHREALAPRAQAPAGRLAEPPAT